jgi:enamine deaminase RidA (YjgF/YER057c/UK114 family)
MHAPDSADTIPSDASVPAAAAADASQAAGAPRRVANVAPWAGAVGYSRAVRIGRTIAVSGTAAVGPDGSIVHPGDPYRQMRRCLEIVVAALAELGAGPADVIRTRVYVKDASYWPEVGRAHGEVFGAAPPASTMVVAEMIDPAMLVEMEADAILP